MSNPTETEQAPKPFAAATGSALVDLPARVVYRTGRPERSDYAKAISDLNLAATQLRPDGAACAVCGDSGHQAWECHHNPLVMARRGARKGREWRCFYCGLVFYDPISAEEHFGKQGTPKKAKCQQGSALPAGMSREDAVGSLRELRNLATAAEAKANPGFHRWPDLDSLIDHIAEHGFPPNAERSDGDVKGTK